MPSPAWQDWFPAAMPGFDPANGFQFRAVCVNLSARCISKIYFPGIAVSNHIVVASVIGATEKNIYRLPVRIGGLRAVPNDSARC